MNGRFTADDQARKLLLRALSLGHIARAGPAQGWGILASTLSWRAHAKGNLYVGTFPSLSCPSHHRTHASDFHADAWQVPFRGGGSVQQEQLSMSEAGMDGNRSLSFLHFLQNNNNTIHSKVAESH